MILGSCPYDDCDRPLMLEMPPDNIRLPVWGSDECEYCNREIVTQFSRVDPKSVTRDVFDEMIESNDQGVSYG